MRIAQVAPLYESVPPTAYGGTERVVSYLTEELVRKGHEVTLFASGDSVTQARLEPQCPRSLRLDPNCHDPIPYHLKMLGAVYQRGSEFDIIHSHADYLSLPMTQLADTPTVVTLHGRLDIPDQFPLFAQYAEVPLVSISNAQRAPVAIANWAATVYHGLPTDLYTFQPRTGSYLVFVGRIASEKRPESAIAIAQAAGVPLRIAAKVDAADRDYYEKTIRPLMNSPLVEFIGEVNEEQKRDLLGHALALVFPIDWPEPFGLVLIEALACGTPVIARRRGSVPELLRDGETGFVCETEAEMVQAVRRAGKLSRLACRKDFEQRFTAEIMATRYEAVYEALAARARPRAPRLHRRAESRCHQKQWALNATSGESSSLASAVASERIKIGHQYYILASALSARRAHELLNHGDGFAILDYAGDIPLAGQESYGLFYRDTRFLNRFELRLNGEIPLTLSSATSDDGSELVTHLSNVDEYVKDEVVLMRDTVALQRSKVLVGDTLFERIDLHNYGLQPLDLNLTVLFGSDFTDLFEVRGIERKRRGVVRAPRRMGNSVSLSYRGLDEVERKTVLTFSPTPTALTDDSANYEMTLAPGGESVLDIRVRCCVGSAAPTSTSFFAARSQIRAERQQWREQFPQLRSNNAMYDDWLRRSLADVAILNAQTQYGPYVHAGIPWFATVFGRDGLIAALEILAFSPALAAGTLRMLAAFQGTTYNAERDEEPGKILHEMRQGEMAALGEVPFGRYYGSVDSTPLFLMLLVAYAERTADVALVNELWPAALAAMNWIDTVTAADPDGYIRYACRAERGLVNQGWKDSHDAISHADGSLAVPPIALAEVQGYVYAARRGMAALARRLGRTGDAAGWEDRADLLRGHFNRDFWMEDQDTFALALDGSKRPCRVVSSNAGQCLFSGIADPDHADRTIARMLREDMFSGWGIRTLSAQAARYNPMSYHNGSVWPHDNALIAAGFAACGGCHAAARLLTAFFEAALMESRRLPELFCGFPHSSQRERPVPYPVACKPQAWSAGCAFLLLQSTLGLRIDAWKRRLSFNRAAPPPWLERLEIRGLRVRDARIDLCITRGRFGAAAIEVIDKEKEIEVVVHK